MIGIFFNNPQDVSADILNNKAVHIIIDVNFKSNIKQYIKQNNLNALIELKSGESINMPISFNPNKSAYVQIQAGTWVDKQKRLLEHNATQQNCQSIIINSKTLLHPFLPESQNDLVKIFQNKEYDLFTEETNNRLKKDGINKNTFMLLFYNAIINGLIQDKTNLALKFVRQGLEYKHDFSELYTVAGDIYLKNDQNELAIQAYEMSIKNIKERNKYDLFPVSYNRSYNYALNQIESIKQKYSKVKKIVTLRPNDSPLK